jgi:hypothetical protein
MLVRRRAAVAGGQPQRCEHRQGERTRAQVHQRFVEEAEPVELDAPPIDGDAVELLVSLLVLPDELPVPVAPIELVPPDDVPGVVPMPALPVVVPLLLIEPPEPGDDGDVEAVDELDGEEPGVVVLDAVLDSRFVHAPSDMAATTASTPAVICVRVIFIRNSL